NRSLDLEIIQKYYNKLSHIEILSNYNLDYEIIKKIIIKTNAIDNLWSNPLNMCKSILKINKKKYSLSLAEEIPQELIRRETLRNRKVFDCCIHEINLNIRDTKNGT